MSYKKVFTLSSGSIVNTIVSGFFGIYVTRMLGPHDKGLLTIALTSCDLMSTLFSLGVPYSAAYFVRARPGCESAVRKFANRTMLLCAAASLLLVALGRELFSGIFLGGWQVDPTLAALLVATVAVNSGNSIIGAALIARGDSGGYVMSTNAGTAINVLLTAALLATVPQKLHCVVVGGLAGNLIATVMMRKRYRLYDLRGQKTTSVGAREFFSYALKVQSGSIATLLLKRMDLYIISSVLNPAAVGFYSVGVGLRDLAMTFSRSLGGLSGGDMSDPGKQADGTARLIFRKGVVFNAVSSLAITLAALLLFPYLIPLAYGDSFAQSVHTSMVIMGSLLPLSVAFLVGKAIQAKGKPLHLSASNVTAAALSSVVAWILTNRFEAEGAAVATIVNSTLLLLSGVYFLRRSGSWLAASQREAALPGERMPGL